MRLIKVSGKRWIVDNRKCNIQQLVVILMPILNILSLNIEEIHNDILYLLLWIWNTYQKKKIKSRKLYKIKKIITF